MTSARLTRRASVLARLRESGAGPKRSLGQNFLVSDIVIDKILNSVKLEKFSHLIEVGPGLGALTEDLIEISRERKTGLTLIELDRAFAAEWNSRSQAEPEGMKVVEADALQVDWRQLGLPQNTLFVSNLPYQISSSIVIERCLEPAGITRMILMFQKEVAQRIGALHSTEAYGLLTVIAQTFWETSTVADAGQKDFFPPPNVQSRVLMFKNRSGTPVGREADQFLKFAKAGFAQRRKLLSKNLGAVGLKPESILPVFEKMGLKTTARAEELSPAQFLALFRELAPLANGV